jgi:cytochrome c553
MNKNKEKMIKQYKEGYRHHPESMGEIKAMEKLSADAFESVSEKFSKTAKTKGITLKNLLKDLKRIRHNEA